MEYLYLIPQTINPQTDCTGIKDTSPLRNPKSNDNADRLQQKSQCRNSRRKQLRLAERQRKSEFIQSQIQLFPFERQPKPMNSEKKSKKTSIALLTMKKAKPVKAKSDRHHYNSNLHSLWNLCMAHPHMMDMLLCAYPALWKTKAAALESSRPNQNVDLQEDEAFQLPYIHKSSKKQRNVSQSMTCIKAKRNSHARTIHDTAHVDVFLQSYTSSTAVIESSYSDMTARSPRFMSTPVIVIPMFNDDDLIMKPFPSVVPDLKPGRILLDDVTVESKMNVLLPGHLHHLDDDDMSIHSSDFLMALEGIHVDHSEDSIGKKVGAIIVDTIIS